MYRLGWIPDLPDHRDRLLSVEAVRPLPPAVDLRTHCPPVYDQGDLGSCTANAIAGAIEFDQMRQGLPEARPSRLFIYYEERVKEHTVSEDAGAMIRDGIKVTAKVGAPPEILWPYAVQRFAVKPSADAFAAALEHRIASYARVPQTAGMLKGTLASRFPVVFGFSCYESLLADAVTQTGDVPLPARHEHQIGGHAVLLIGYDDATERFRFRNSWGTVWGAAGYGTLPYAYVVNPDLADDFWVIRLTQ